MKLQAPIAGVLAWLQKLRDEGCESVAEEIRKRGNDVPTVRLLDPLKRNVFLDPTKGGKP